MRKLLTIGAMTLAGATTQASAATSVLTFSGTISTNPSDATQPLDSRNLFGGFKVGDPISVSYYYDRDSFKTVTENSSRYLFDKGIQKYSVNVAGRELVVEKSLYFQFATAQDETVFGGGFQRLGLAIFSESGTADIDREVLGASVNVYAKGAPFVSGGSNIFLSDYASVDLKEFDQRLSFDGNVLGGVDDADSFLSIDFRPTNVTVSSASAVPEPATWAMMIIGFGVVGYALRRRKTEVRFA